MRSDIWSAVGAVFMVAWATGASAQTVLDQSFPEEASIDVPEMHRLVSADFLDPSSAQYKGLSLVTRYDGHQYICGWVNAKNSFGGYTPFYPFYVDIEFDRANVGDGYQDRFVGEMVLMTFQTVGCSRPLGLESSPVDDIDAIINGSAQ